MGKVISITLRKGGSGKTTTAVSLASSLAEMGKKTLLLDLDPQANATISLGLDPNTTPHIAEVLSGAKDVSQVITETGRGFDLIAGNRQLAQIEATLATEPSKYAQIIKSVLSPLLPRYDYILIDTPPSESMLTVTALVASDYALIPTQAHYLALHGLEQAIELIQRVQGGYNPELQILGIVPTMVQANTNMATLFIEQVKETYPELLLPYPVPYTIKVSESQLTGVPINEYDPNHPATEAYNQLANYIIER